MDPNRYFKHYSIDIRFDRILMLVYDLGGRVLGKSWSEFFANSPGCSKMSIDDFIQ